MSGWLKLHRSTLKWEWYHHLPTRVLFMHLLLIANREPSTFQGEPVPVGGKAVGRKQLAKETGLSEQQIRTALINLQSTNEITIKSTKKFSVVTLVNWATYQDGKIKQPSNQPSEQPQINRKSTTEEEVINNKSLLPPYIPPQLWKDFEEHRNKLRKPMTDRAKQEVLGKIEKFRQQGFSPHDLLATAIERGWLTVYEPREEKNAQGTNKKSKSDTADAAAERAFHRSIAHLLPEQADSGTGETGVRYLQHLREGPEGGGEHDVSLHRSPETVHDG